MRPAGITETMRIRDAHESTFTGLRFASSGRKTYYYSTPSAAVATLLNPAGYPDGFSTSLVDGVVVGATGSQQGHRLRGFGGDPTAFVAGYWPIAVTPNGTYGTWEGAGNDFGVLFSSPSAAPTILPTPAGAVQFGIRDGWGDLGVGSRSNATTWVGGAIYRGTTLTNTTPSSITKINGRSMIVKVDNDLNTLPEGKAKGYAYLTPSMGYAEIPLSASTEYYDVFAANLLCKRGGVTFIENFDRSTNPIVVHNDLIDGGNLWPLTLSTDSEYWYVGGSLTTTAENPVVYRSPVTVQPTTNPATLLTENFNSPTFVSGSVSGQNSWAVDPPASSSLMQMAPGFRGTNYGVTVQGSLVTGSPVYAFKGFSYNGATDTRKVIAGSARVKISGLGIATGTRTYAGLSAWSGTTKLAEVLVDPAGFILLSDGVSTATQYEYACSDNWLLITLSLDFVDRVIRAYVNGIPYPVTMPLPGTLTTVSDFDLTVTPGGAQEVKFDDLVVKSGAARRTLQLTASPSDHVAPETVPVVWNVTGAGGYSFGTTTVGPYLVLDVPSNLTEVTVTADASHWTRKRSTVPISGGTTFASFNLPNGDADASGEVDAADIDLIIADFGGSGAMTDVDGSGEVDAADIDIVIANFGSADE